MPARFCAIALALAAFACGGSGGSSGGGSSGGSADGGSGGGSGADGGTADGGSGEPTEPVFYVDANKGSDTNDGRRPTTAFATLARAARDVKPGWSVLVMSGTYTSDGTVDPLVITQQGTKDAPITFAAAPGQHPIIRIPRGPGAFDGIHLAGAAFVVIDGFEVVGQNATITPQEAAANDGTQAVLNENCVYIDGMGFGPYHPPVPHDVTVRNCELHGCSAGGLEVNVADGVVLEHNHIYDNGWYTVFGTSGLGLYHLTDVPGTVPDRDGYRNRIVGNLIHGNRNTLNWKDGTPPGIYDGNGMIIDDSRHTQRAIGLYDVQGVPYTGRSYVANNIVHDNGGHGIHVYASDHVDVVNNTTWNNLLTQSEHISEGEIDAQASADDVLLNNLAANFTGKAVNLADGNLYDYNVWQGSPQTTGPHDVVGQLLLADPAGGDFSPKTGSPALKSGTDRLAPPTDFFGNPRRAGAIDRGAIQVTR